MRNQEKKKEERRVDKPESMGNLETGWIFNFPTHDTTLQSRGEFYALQFLR